MACVCLVCFEAEQNLKKEIKPRCEAWCWNIHLLNSVISGVNVGIHIPAPWFSFMASRQQPQFQSRPHLSRCRRCQGSDEINAEADEVPKSAGMISASPFPRCEPWCIQTPESCHLWLKILIVFMVFQVKQHTQMLHVWYIYLQNWTMFGVNVDTHSMVLEYKNLQDWMRNLGPTENVETYSHMGF